VRTAREQGLTVIQADARDIGLHERSQLQEVGNLLALTDNEDLNVRLCQNWAEVFGPGRVYRCHPAPGQPDHEDDDHAPVGHVVWAKLPRPSLVSGELNRDEATVLTYRNPGSAIGQSGTPLMHVRGATVSFDALPEKPAEGEGDRVALGLRRRADYLLRALRPELVLSLEATDLEDLLKQMVDRIVEHHPALPRDETVAELLDREKTFPTALGHGVAVPHAYASALEARVCAIARVPAGLDFGASDGEPVRLVFLLLSPQGDPEGHLATLADIAHLVVEGPVREGLISSSSPLEVLRFIRLHRSK